jgi:hypothetical protein
MQIANCRLQIGRSDWGWRIRSNRRQEVLTFLKRSAAEDDQNLLPSIATEIGGVP